MFFFPFPLIVGNDSTEKNSCAELLLVNQPAGIERGSSGKVFSETLWIEEIISTTEVIL